MARLTLNLGPRWRSGQFYPWRKSPEYQLSRGLGGPQGYAECVGYEINVLLYALFWVIPQCLNFICRHFRTVCPFHLHRQVGVKND